MRIAFYIISLLFATCAAGQVGVRTHIVESKVFSESFTAIGKIRQGSSRSYMAASAGRIDFVTDKIVVKKGDIIISVDGEIAKATRDEARLDKQYALAQLQRDKKLLKRGVAAREVVEQSEVKFKAASIKAASGERLYEDSVIVAAFDANVMPIAHKIGDRVERGDLLCKMTQGAGEYGVTLELPEKLLGKIDDKTIVHVKTEESKIPAKIILVGDSLKNTGSFTVKISIEKSQLATLRDGRYAAVEMLHSMRTSVALPEGAIMLSDAGHFVYRVNKDNIVEKISVIPGTRDGGYASLVSGDIAQGDRIIADGMVKVTQGAKVLIVSDK